MSHEIISTFSVAFNFFQAHKFHLIIFSKFLCRNFLMDEVLIAIVCVFPSFATFSTNQLNTEQIRKKDVSLNNSQWLLYSFALNINIF